MLLGTLDYACSRVIWFIRMGMELFRFYSEMGIVIRWMFIFYRARWAGFFSFQHCHWIVRPLTWWRKLLLCHNTRWLCPISTEKRVEKVIVGNKAIAQCSYDDDIVKHLNFGTTKSQNQTKPNANATFFRPRKWRDGAWTFRVA